MSTAEISGISNVKNVWCHHRESVSVGKQQQLADVAAVDIYRLA